MTITRKILEDVGLALYGELWQSAIARDLAVATRTVQRWHAGEREIPDLRAELGALLRTRRERIAALEKQIAK